MNKGAVEYLDGTYVLPEEGLPPSSMTTERGSRAERVSRARDRLEARDVTSVWWASTSTDRICRAPCVLPPPDGALGCQDQRTPVAQG
jgi:hypothetical protein